MTWNINLDNKFFSPISSTDNGESSSATIFHYRQHGNIIWATYHGGEILFGTLSGKIEEDQLRFSYQHQNLHGEFLTGKCDSTVEFINGKLVLLEQWEWTCKDFSKGRSILEQIPDRIK